MADERRPVHDDARPATTEMLKAYAHPLRRRIAKVLVARGFARAADVAADLGVPANSVSFHLRVLADAGLIEEAPEHARDRRDRVWKASPAAWNIGSPEHPIADEVLGNAVMAALADDHIEVVRRVMTWAPEYVAGRTTEVHGTFSQAILRLSEANFRELERRIQEVLKEVEDAQDPDDPDIRAWSFEIVAADDRI
ncbi:DNA-binding transcriptional ArsR family regulator [Microbacterium ginsengiterrae]|uniref:DNA-binding transcriptional ArsR family regulator n=1 Tax=Microbacterium ginsengiterrae TaxID=546115 RepID=A0A7W9CC12_9MICO|nr:MULTISPECIES: helix-turn-helix domain-containing protein [Microbacterium]MBB5742820.1 DNA-binding transcriptional ArsR family regulator [Microbacterium ginsengiterrae]